MTQSDGSRFAGVALLFIGRLLLLFSLFFLATEAWLGLPTTTTPLRLAVFALLGLALGLLGYRISSGIWARAWQLPLQAAALAGLFFLALLAAKEIKSPRPPLPPAWIMAVAALAPLSWWLAAPSRRRRKT